jgi:hypothetical protein
MIINTAMSVIMVGSAGRAIAVRSVIGVANNMAIGSFESEALLAAAKRWLVMGPSLSVITHRVCPEDSFGYISAAILSLLA